MNLLDNGRFLLGLKIAVFLFMGYVITDRLVLAGDFKQQVHFFANNLNGTAAWWLLAAILLMPVNWLVEVFKWRVLIQNPGVSFSSLLKGVIAGITVGFVTPGRTGEFIGRIMYMDEQNKTRIFYLSSIGGIAQTVVTLIAGALVISYFTNDALITGITIGLALVFLLFYFRFSWLNSLLQMVPLLQRYNLVISNAELPPLNIQLQVLGMALLRFIIYSAQYVLILQFFGLTNNAAQLGIHVIVFLLAQTFSPLMPLFDISYRGGSALYVFKNVTENNLAVLCTVTLVWMLNLVLPALVGYLFILRKKRKTA